MRVDGHVRAGAGQPPQDRALAAVVDDRDPDRPRVAVDVRLRGGDEVDEGGARHRRQLADGGESLLLVHPAGDGCRAHRAALAQAQHERARVDAGERDDPALGEPVRPLGPARLAHQHRLRVRARRLGATGGDAVVADHRRREADELLGEARVGDGLLVAGHRGREDRLAEGDALRADRLAAEDRPVLERQEGAHPCTSRPSATVFRTVPWSVLPEQPRVRGAGAEAGLLDRPLRFEVEQDEVRAGADLESRLGQPERARRAGGHPLEQRLQRQQPRLDEVGVERRERRLEARDAERRRLEGRFLLLPRVRRVVGGDGRDRAAAERLEQRAPVLLGAQRRIHLHVRIEAADGLVGEHEVMRRHLRGRLHPARLGGLERLDRLPRRQVHQVQRTAPRSRRARGHARPSRSRPRTDSPRSRAPRTPCPRAPGRRATASAPRSGERACGR